MLYVRLNLNVHVIQCQEVKMVYIIIYYTIRMYISILGDFLGI